MGSETDGCAKTATLLFVALAIAWQSAAADIVYKCVRDGVVNYTARPSSPHGECRAVKIRDEVLEYTPRPDRSYILNRSGGTPGPAPRQNLPPEGEWPGWSSPPSSGGWDR